MVRLVKHYNWEFELVQFINSELGKPFEWGRRDCVAFALDCLKVMVGDFDHPSLTYTTEQEALRFAESHSLYDFLKGFNGVEDVREKYEQRGDLVFGHNGRFECCHVVLGSKVASLDFDAGVCLIPLRLLTARKTLRIT